MKAFTSSIAAMVVVLSFLGCAQDETAHSNAHVANATTPSMTLKDQEVEVACAMCMLDVPDMTGCATAIRVNGVVFMAEGKDIPDAEDHDTGVCKAIKKARVSGTTQGSRFIATSFVMLP